MRLEILLLLTACGRYAFDRPGDAATDTVVDAAKPRSTIGTGCSDGTREAFNDEARFPSIAGCAAAWSATPSLRAARTNGACGNTLGDCSAPADACDVGWHICGDTGNPTDISARITVDDCRSAAGSFVAALQHCVRCNGGCAGANQCVYASNYGCSATPESCTEPVCCGADCNMSNVCKLTVYPSPGTNIGLTDGPCGALSASSQAGVLCCQ